MVLALKLWIAAAALGLGAMAFSASTEARGFGGFGSKAVLASSSPHSAVQLMQPKDWEDSKRT